MSVRNQSYVIVSESISDASRVSPRRQCRSVAALLLRATDGKISLSVVTDDDQVSHSGWLQLQNGI